MHASSSCFEIELSEKGNQDNNKLLNTILNRKMAVHARVPGKKRKGKAFTYDREGRESLALSPLVIINLVFSWSLCASAKAKISVFTDRFFLSNTFCAIC